MKIDHVGREAHFSKQNHRNDSCVHYFQKTTAHRRLKDDVESSVKNERIRRMVTVFRTEAEKLNKSQIGQLQLVLIEGVK